MEYWNNLSDASKKMSLINGSLFTIFICLIISALIGSDKYAYHNLSNLTILGLSIGTNIICIITSCYFAYKGLYMENNTEELTDDLMSELLLLIIISVPYWASSIYFMNKLDVIIAIITIIHFSWVCIMVVCYLLFLIIGCIYKHCHNVDFLVRNHVRNLL